MVAVEQFGDICVKLLIGLWTHSMVSKDFFSLIKNDQFIFFFFSFISNFKHFTNLALFFVQVDDG